MGLFCIHDIEKATGGELTWSPMPPRDGGFTFLGRSVCRSAEVASGDLYWHFDEPKCGPDTVEEAFARGAIGVVSSRTAAPWAGMFSLRVPDVGRAAARTAVLARERFPGVTVAIGGPAGKTVVRRLIDTVLEASFRGCDADDFAAISEPSLSHPIASVCDMRRYWMALASLPSTAEYAAIELHTASLSAWKDRLSQARPRAVVLTGWPIDDEPLAACSLADARAFDAVPSDAWLIANGDDARLRRALASRDQVVWYGRGGGNDLVAENVRCLDGALSFQIGSETVALPAHGRQHVDAALAAFAVGRLFEIGDACIAEAMTRFRPPPKRCEVVRAGGFTLVNDASRWAQASLAASFDAARELSATGRRIVVLGGFSASDDAPQSLRHEAGRAAVTRCGADLLVACGDGGETVRAAAIEAGMPGRRAFAVADPLQAVDVVRSCIRPGDVVLVKGAASDAIAELLGTIHPAR